jgi:response regulator RpfG family c-di-GMP phosphodiesterase
MKALVVHTDPRVSGIITFVIESNFGAQVVQQQSLQGAIDILSQDKNFTLVVYSVTQERDELFKPFFSLKNGIPAILVTQNAVTKVDNALDANIIDCTAEDNLVGSLADALQRQIKAGKLKFVAAEEGAAEEYCRISTKLLIEASPLEAPIFIRLSEHKHIKIINVGDSFDEQDLEKYAVKKKLEYLHIKKSDAPHLIKRFTKVIDIQIQKIDAGEELEVEMTLDLTISANEMIQELATRMGYTEEVKQLVNQNVNLAVKSMKTMPTLQQLMARLEQDKDRYISAHSTITAFVACAMSKSMSYASEATYQKLTMSAFLHDITLTNHDLAMLRNTEDLELVKEQFTADEYKAFEDHPKLSAEIARSISTTIADVDIIILQHHEFADGKGFPNKLSALQISPLSAIFIIAHEFVLCSIEGTITNPAMLAELATKFNQGNFKQVFKQINTKELTKEI